MKLNESGSWSIGVPPKVLSMIVVLVTILGGCATASPYDDGMDGRENSQRTKFRQDRDVCKRVAEQSTPYVDPKDGNAVSARSVRVEMETQKCMLSRGWNDPQHNGWSKGRDR